MRPQPNGEMNMAQDHARILKLTADQKRFQTHMRGCAVFAGRRKFDVMACGLANAAQAYDLDFTLFNDGSVIFHHEELNASMYVRYCTIGDDPSLLRAPEDLRYSIKMPGVEIWIFQEADEDERAMV